VFGSPALAVLASVVAGDPADGVVVTEAPEPPVDPDPVADPVPVGDPVPVEDPVLGDDPVPELGLGLDPLALEDPATTTVPCMNGWIAQM
jgi:hypothetical protein